MRCECVGEGETSCNRQTLPGWPATTGSHSTGVARTCLPHTIPAPTRVYVFVILCNYNNCAAAKRRFLSRCSFFYTFTANANANANVNTTQCLQCTKYICFWFVVDPLTVLLISDYRSLSPSFCQSKRIASKFIMTSYFIRYFPCISCYLNHIF